MTLQSGRPDGLQALSEIDFWTLRRELALVLRESLAGALEAGLLSKRGVDELAAIKVRRDYLDRPVEDRDFFGSYMSEVTVVTGDPSPIVEAADEDRLEVALQVRASRDLQTQRGWNAYARQDPEGAFKTLIDAPRSEPNAPPLAEIYRCAVVA